MAAAARAAQHRLWVVASHTPVGVRLTANHRTRHLQRWENRRHRLGRPLRQGQSANQGVTGGRSHLYLHRPVGRPRFGRVRLAG